MRARGDGSGPLRRFRVTFPSDAPILARALTIEYVTGRDVRLIPRGGHS